MGSASARLRAERINLKIIARFAMRRVREGEALGERVAAGAARAAVELVEINEVSTPRIIDGPRGAEVEFGEVVQITEFGKKAARRKLPAVLRRLDERDARRIAADRYAIASEQIGAMAGVSVEGQKTDGGAASNDGGVTNRIRHAATIDAVKSVLARAGVVLAPSGRGGGSGRKPISAQMLMDAVCLEGMDMKAILRRAGWSGQGRDAVRLNACAAICLELMARRLGLVSGGAPLPT